MAASRTIGGEEDQLRAAKVASSQDAGSDVAREAEERAEIAALSSAQLVIVPLACKDVYLDRYARPEKGWTDKDESRWPVPYWYIDTGFTALLILLAVVDEAWCRVLRHPAGDHGRFPHAVRDPWGMDANWCYRDRLSRSWCRPGAARARE